MSVRKVIEELKRERNTHIKVTKCTKENVTIAVRAPQQIRRGGSLNTIPINLILDIILANIIQIQKEYKQDTTESK